VPSKLTVADVVSVAMPEIDPVAVVSADGPSATTDGVRRVEQQHAFAAATENRAGHQTAERRSDDRDVDRARPRGVADLHSALSSTFAVGRGLRPREGFA